MTLKAVRVVGLVIGLGVLALVWLIGFIVLWGLLSGTFLSGKATEPSGVVIAVAVLSYLFAAALLFGKRLS